MCDFINHTKLSPCTKPCRSDKTHQSEHSTCRKMSLVYLAIYHIKRKQIAKMERNCAYRRKMNQLLPQLSHHCHTDGTLLPNHYGSLDYLAFLSKPKKDRANRNLDYAEAFDEVISHHCIVRTRLRSIYQLQYFPQLLVGLRQISKYLLFLQAPFQIHFQNYPEEKKFMTTCMQLTIMCFHILEESLVVNVCVASMLRSIAMTVFQEERSCQLQFHLQ